MMNQQAWKIIGILFGILLILYTYKNLEKPNKSVNLLTNNKLIKLKDQQNGNQRRKEENKERIHLPTNKSTAAVRLQNKHAKGVFYLKVNKAGSSTLQIMFNQYADKHNQIVAMPCSNTGGERHLVGWPEPFKPEHLIPLSKNVSYWEHLNEHIKYSSKIKEVMAPGSTFIASIREPFSHFYSYYNFYGMEKTYGKYLKGPEKFKFFLNNIKTMPHLELIHHMPPSNPIAECFGMSRKLQYNIKAIKEKISEIEKDFDLIMVVEYLDESLILLTECSELKIEDVVILQSKNVRNIKKSKPSLTPKEHQNLLRWNLADSMIYDHFNKTLWEKIDKYGRNKMAIKIKELNKAKLLIQKRCDLLKGKTNLTNSIDLEQKKSCVMLSMDYRQADNYFRYKMTQKGIYDIKKAQKTCKYPPNQRGQ